MAVRIGKFTKVLIDDTGGTPRDISGDVMEIDGLPMKHDELEAGGYGYDHHYVPGLSDSTVTLTMKFSTTAATGTHTIFPSIVGPRTTSLTLTVQIGNNAAPTTGDPEFEGEFYVFDYTVAPPRDNIVSSKAVLKVAEGQAAPAWGTVT